MSHLTRIGTLIVVVGAVIDLLYHGVLDTMSPLPVWQANIVQYAGHGVTFIGMLIMLLGGLLRPETRPGRSRPFGVAPPTHPNDMKGQVIVVADSTARNSAR